MQNSQSDGPLDFSSDFFEIFSIPVAWDIDLNGLDIRYRALQQEFHPDRYATKPDVEKRLAVQSASLINQAFDTLKSPLKRAQYLLELNSVDASQEAHITTDTGFLMQQIEFRESLSGISEKQDPWVELDRLKTEIEQTYIKLQSEFQNFFSENALDLAFNTVAKMQFFSKLLTEIGHIEDEMDDA